MIENNLETTQQKADKEFFWDWNYGSKNFLESILNNIPKIKKDLESADFEQKRVWKELMKKVLMIFSLIEDEKIIYLFGHFSLPNSDRDFSYYFTRNMEKYSTTSSTKKFLKTDSLELTGDVLNEINLLLEEEHRTLETFSEARYCALSAGAYFIVSNLPKIDKDSSRIFTQYSVKISDHVFWYDVERNSDGKLKEIKELYTARHTHFDLNF